MKKNKHGLPVIPSKIRKNPNSAQEKKRVICREVYNKCEGKCYYCGEIIFLNTFTIDHYLAIHNGGTDDDHNLVPACHSCNNTKGHMSIVQFRNIFEIMFHTCEFYGERILKKS